METDKDHVHVLLEYSPQISASDIANKEKKKGRTAVHSKEKRKCFIFFTCSLIFMIFIMSGCDLVELGKDNLNTISNAIDMVEGNGNSSGTVTDKVSKNVNDVETGIRTKVSPAVLNFACDVYAVYRKLVPLMIVFSIVIGAIIIGDVKDSLKIRKRVFVSLIVVFPIFTVAVVYLFAFLIRMGNGVQSAEITFNDALLSVEKALNNFKPCVPVLVGSSWVFAYALYFANRGYKKQQKKAVVTFGLTIPLFVIFVGYGWNIVKAIIA